MKVIGNLIFQKIKNSYRRLFYKKIVICNVIFLLSMLYITIILIKASYLLKITLNRNDINIYMFSIYFITLITVLDLAIKLIFSQVKISNIYPFLRLNIQRTKLANFVIIMNHFNIINLIWLLLIIPITIICIGNLELWNIVLILISLSVIFIFNNYVSMITSIMRVKLHSLVVIPIMLFFLYLVFRKVIANGITTAIEIRPIGKVFFILTTLLLSRLCHWFLKKEIIKILYIK
jgi:hypothetical protein